MPTTNNIYLPSTGAHDWQWLLAQPGKHWKHGASAMALADAWEATDWPPAVSAALASDTDLEALDLLLALPEHEVPLPGGNRASQTDLFVLAGQSSGDLASIAVEGKAEEPFGDQTVAEWRDGAGEGKETRLAYLLSVLDLPDDERLAGIRYQLLHRTASALIEARRFGARTAVMLVHSFSEADSSFAEFAAFAGLYEATIDVGSVARVREIDGLSLHLGWVRYAAAT